MEELMYKNIVAQTCDTEQEQERNDEVLSKLILEKSAKNYKAFEKYIPSLSKLVKNHSFSEKSLFLNKKKNINILNFKNGSTVYGIDSKEQQAQHFHHFFTNRERYAVTVSVNSARTAQQLQKSAYICFGLGLGEWLPRLINSNPSHIIIYEPDLDIVKASALTIDWASVLERCDEENIKLYLQFGEDASNIRQDTFALFSAESITHFYLYRHLCYDDFDWVWSKLIREEMSLDELPQVPVKPFDSAIEQVPLFSLWPEQVAGKIISSTNIEDVSNRKHNLKALEEFYPDLYSQIISYEPKHWVLFKNSDGTHNLLNVRRQAFWYDYSAEDDEAIYASYFEKKPGVVNPVLGGSGGILKDYIHFRYVEKFKELKNSLTSDKRVLPNKIPALMCFSPCLGFGVSELLKKRETQAIFWVEPNVEFFYWSLSVLNWNEILKNAFEENNSVFLHVGSDGQDLTDELSERINSSAGSYIINSYYYTPFLLKKTQVSIRKLLEEMVTVLGLTESYDHARLAISHIYKNLNSGVKVLSKKDKLEALPNGIDTPVFIVGNGPSLDSDIEKIKEVRDEVIVISCGTTLKALWANGIQPDFHAEVEQHKNFYNIVNSLNDPDYLKGITLLGGAWIYPEASKLFKNVLTLFKEGEGATQALLRYCQDLEVEKVINSFPTVANFAVSFCCQIGFRNIYLFGIDLGFIDIEAHHSKSSIFYNNRSGGALYSPKEQGWHAFPVKGNFQRIVLSKFDFHMSAKILEKTIKRFPEVDFYNCSNGIKIEGTYPLHSDMLLINSSSNEKNIIIKAIEEDVFKGRIESRILDVYNKHFDADKIVESIDKLIEILEVKALSEKQVSNILLEQKQYLTDEYFKGNEFFYSLFIATVSYIHSILVHFLYYGESWEEREKVFSKAQAISIEYLRECRDDFAKDPMRIDDTDWELIKKL